MSAISREIDLKPDYVKIRSALPVTVNGNIESTYPIGTIRAGGPKRSATTNGDISIGTLAPLHAGEKVTSGK